MIEKIICDDSISSAQVGMGLYGNAVVFGATIFRSKDILDMGDGEVDTVLCNSMPVLIESGEFYDFEISKRYLKFLPKSRILMESDDMESWVSCAPALKALPVEDIS